MEGVLHKGSCISERSCWTHSLRKKNLSVEIVLLKHLLGCPIPVSKQHINKIESHLLSWGCCYGDSHLNRDGLFSSASTPEHGWICPLVPLHVPPSSWQSQWLETFLNCRHPFLSPRPMLQDLLQSWHLCLPWEWVSCHFPQLNVLGTLSSSLAHSFLPTHSDKTK